MPYTLGFATPKLRQSHFLKHRVEFGIMTEGDYENLADTFLGESISAATHPTIQECVRAANQDILRYKFHYRGIWSTYSGRAHSYLLQARSSKAWICYEL